MPCFKLWSIPCFIVFMCVCGGIGVKAFFYNNCFVRWSFKHCFYIHELYVLCFCYCNPIVYDMNIPGWICLPLPIWYFPWRNQLVCLPICLSCVIWLKMFIFYSMKVHFVEMDPWVVSEVLKPNLEWTGFLDVSVIHMARVENFIQNAEKFLGICSIYQSCFFFKKKMVCLENDSKRRMVTNLQWMHHNPLRWKKDLWQGSLHCLW